MSDRYRLLARKVKGCLIFDSPTHFQGVLAALPERISVTLERERVLRSAQANRRYWGLIVPIAADIFSINRDVPISNDQAHEILKQAFLGTEDTPLGKVGKSTRGLSTAEFAEYTQKIEAWFTSTYGTCFDGPEVV